MTISRSTHFFLGKSPGDKVGISCGSGGFLDWLIFSIFVK